MNINLANGNTFRNYCKYNKLLKTALLRNNSECKLVPVVCHCSTFVNITSNRWFFTDLKNKKNIYFPQGRWFSEEKSGPPSNKLPQLMSNFPKIVWPSLFKSIRNFILATFIIKPYLDREFNLPDFVAGSKKAVEVGSNSISEINSNYSMAVYKGIKCLFIKLFSKCPIRIYVSRRWFQRV